MSPLEQYAYDPKQPGFGIAHKQQAVHQLQGLYERLLAHRANQQRWLSKVRCLFVHKITIDGIVFWGGAFAGEDLFNGCVLRLSAL